MILTQKSFNPSILFAAHRNINFTLPTKLEHDFFLGILYVPDDYKQSVNTLDSRVSTLQVKMTLQSNNPRLRQIIHRPSFSKSEKFFDAFQNIFVFLVLVNQAAVIRCCVYSLFNFFIIFLFCSGQKTLALGKTHSGNPFLGQYIFESIFISIITHWAKNGKLVQF